MKLIDLNEFRPMMYLLIGLQFSQSGQLASFKFSKYAVFKQTQRAQQVSTTANLVQQLMNNLIILAQLLIVLNMFLIIMVIDKEDGKVQAMQLIQQLLFIEFQKQICLLIFPNKMKYNLFVLMLFVIFFVVQERFDIRNGTIPPPPPQPMVITTFDVNVATTPAISREFESVPDTLVLSTRF